MEKVLIQKKIKLNQIREEDLQKLIQFTRNLVHEHNVYLNKMDHMSEPAAEDSSSVLRRVILKSALIIINFIYSK